MSKNEEQYMEHFWLALEKPRAYILEVKMINYRFRLQLVQYLGYVVETCTIKKDLSKLSAVMDWPILSDVKRLQSFSGLYNCHNHFIR